MRLEADRLDALRKTKLRALAGATGTIAADAVDASFPKGAVLTDPSNSTTWVLAEEDADRRLGGALAVAIRAASSTLHLIVTDASHAAVLARRARSLTGPEIGIWLETGGTIERAEPAPPAPDPVPPPGAELYRPVLEDAGLEVIVEDGQIRGEYLGLEAARVVIDPDGSAHLEAGIGRFDREAGAMMRSGMGEVEALRVVVDLIRPVRRAGADPHPMNQLVPERWLRRILVERPHLVGAADLQPVGSALPRQSLRGAGVASALGHDVDGEPILVTASVGIDLDLVPSAVDDRLTHAPDARLVVVTPAADAAPITGELVDLVDGAEMRIVPDDWMQLPEQDG